MRQAVLAIDPGPTESAWAIYDGAKVIGHGKAANELVLVLRHHGPVVIEQIASYGMPVGSEVFETCVWTGRFIERFGAVRCDRIPRKKVCTHLCGSARAKDANIRQALIDRLGAPGIKKKPGGTYGLKGDEWSALAVGITWWETPRK